MPVYLNTNAERVIERSLAAVGEPIRWGSNKKPKNGIKPNWRIVMKIWTKPAVREQEVGLEVTSYLPAEIDVI